MKNMENIHLTSIKFDAQTIHRQEPVFGNTETLCVGQLCMGDQTMGVYQLYFCSTDKTSDSMWKLFCKFF